MVLFLCMFLWLLAILGAWKIMIFLFPTLDD